MQIILWEIRLALYNHVCLNYELKKLPADNRRVRVATKSGWPDDSFKKAAFSAISSYCKTFGFNVSDIYLDEIKCLGNAEMYSEAEEVKEEKVNVECKHLNTC